MGDDKEKQSIEIKETGFKWSISIEKEVRSETGAKYPDKSVIRATLEGHEDTYDMAKINLKLARREIEKELTIQISKLGLDNSKEDEVKKE